MKQMTFDELIKLLLNKNKVEVIQYTLNKLGANLLVDGKYGPNTKRALDRVNESDFIEYIEYTFKELTKPMTKKEEVLNLLARLEGTEVHYNKGEHSITLPYGLYMYAHHNSEPVKFFNSLLKKYRLTTRNVIAGQHIISKEDKDKLIDLIYQYYITHMFVKDVTDTLTGGELYVYMSNTILAHTIGMKALQHALGVKPDGVFGPITKYVLEFKAGKEALGMKQIEYMRGYLIKVAKRPDKSMYLKGWMNRLKILETYL